MSPAAIVRSQKTLKSAWGYIHTYFKECNYCHIHFLGRWGLDRIIWYICLRTTVRRNMICVSSLGSPPPPLTSLLTDLMLHAVLTDLYSAERGERNLKQMSIWVSTSGKPDHSIHIDEWEHKFSRHFVGLLAAEVDRDVVTIFSHMEHFESKCFTQSWYFSIQEVLRLYKYSAVKSTSSDNDLTSLRWMSNQMRHQLIRLRCPNFFNSSAPFLLLLLWFVVSNNHSL